MFSSRPGILNLGLHAGSDWLLLAAMSSGFCRAILALSLFAVANAAVVEHFWEATWVWAAPDGFGRPVIGINGEWPCPNIYATKGDQIVVHLTNGLDNQTTSIHWHGINQISTNDMDGPVMATQCPLSPGRTMTYSFVVWILDVHKSEIYMS